MEPKSKRPRHASVSTAPAHGLPMQCTEDITERVADLSQGFATDTPVLMYDGHIKPVQDVRVGDLVMGNDSRYRTVVRIWGGNGTVLLA